MVVPGTLGHDVPVRISHRLVLAVAAPLLLAGCGGGDPTSHVTIKARVTACRSGGDCVVLPAAGAHVKVVDAAGAVVVDDPLNDDGTLGADVDPGDFSVKVSLLKLGSADTSVTVRDGDEVEVSLNLPEVTVSR